MNFKMDRIVIIIFIIFFIALISNFVVFYKINKKLDYIIITTETNQQPYINFIGNFESADFTNWTLGAAREDSIKIVKSPVRAGNYAVKFTIQPGDMVQNGNRAELTCNESFPVGSKIYYKLSFMIPKDYKDEDLWQMFAQFHDKPDFSKGEDWQTYTKKLKTKKLPPPISLSYHQGQIFIKRNNLDESSTIIASTKVKKGKWIDLIIHAKWSLNNDGFIEVFRDGKNISHGKVYGPNVYNNSGNYFKIGFYRDPAIKTTNTLYFDEVYISTSRKDIMK